MVLGRATAGPGGPAGLPAEVAIAAARAGARVELVGSVGDDADGDAVAIGLARAGVGHAALLRDPGAATPRTGRREQRLPRLDGEDVELGLRYLVDYRVLVVAEPVTSDVQRVALDAASYHGAAVVAIVPAGGRASDELAAAATVLEAPADEHALFADLVGRYAAGLDEGREPGEAFRMASRSTGWRAGG